MKSGRINKRFALLAILCVLAMVFAVPVASAAGYSKVYGQTQDKIRVRESASTNATIIDNIVKDACVYITSSKVSGSNTFVQVKYRASDGSTETGWVCQSDGKNTYVKILSAEQAKSKFKVSGGNVPSKAVGTFTAAERKASAANSDNTYIRQNASGETVKRIQTELKALNYYSGKITGNAGEKTVAAIKSFQRKNGLTADGIAGPQTIAKIDAAYESKTGQILFERDLFFGKRPQAQLEGHGRSQPSAGFDDARLLLGGNHRQLWREDGNRRQALPGRKRPNRRRRCGRQDAQCHRGGCRQKGRHVRFQQQRRHGAQAQQPGHECQPAANRP